MPSSPSTPSAHYTYILSAELPFRCGALNLIKSNINTPFMGRAASCRNTNAAWAVGLDLNFAHAHTACFSCGEGASRLFFFMATEWVSEWALGWARKAWSWHIDIKGDLGQKKRRLSDVIAQSAFASQVQTLCMRCLITFSSTARSHSVCLQSNKSATDTYK